MRWDAPPPGWYPDPADPGRHRWWDGRRWTPKALPAARAPELRSRSAGRTVLMVVLVVMGVAALLLAIVVAVVAASFSSYGSNK